jgi:hypothetical protein
MGTEQYGLVLTFPTSTMSGALVGGASIFLRRTALTGNNPIGGTVQVKVKSGGFGGDFVLEAADITDVPDASATACRFGSNAGDGHWIRIDLPAELLPYLQQTDDTQFILSVPGASEGLVTFHDASDPDLAPVLNLRFADITTDSGPDPSPVAGKAFPNPTTGPIDLALPEGAAVQEVRVHDLTGRMVLQRTGDGRMLDLSGLPTGQYVIHVHTTMGRSMQRVVKW